MIKQKTKNGKPLYRYDWEYGVALPVMEFVGEDLFDKAYNHHLSSIAHKMQDEKFLQGESWAEFAIRSGVDRGTYRRIH